MIYVVSGFMRSGTSMMMRALEVGGMNAFYDDGERYELSKEGATDAVLNPSKVEGKMFKCFAGGLTMLAAWDWRILVMQRDYHEIRQSLLDLFGPEEGRFMSEKNYYGLMRYSMGQLDQRRDVKWTGIQYRAVLEDPIKVFEILQETGWPIDTAKAAAVVDTGKCTHRVEEMHYAE